MKPQQRKIEKETESQEHFTRERETEIETFILRHKLNRRIQKNIRKAGESVIRLQAPLRKREPRNTG